MTDQPSQQVTQIPALQANGDAYLRLLVADAVAREASTSLAPLRTMIQVQEGIVKQLNRDYAVLASNFNDLEELVRGNPRQNLLGLADQLKQAQELIGALGTEVRQGINRVESAVTVKLEAAQTQTQIELDAVKAQLAAAEKHRTAVINQLKGARWAFLALGLFTGLAQYKELASLIAMIFS